MFRGGFSAGIAFKVIPGPRGLSEASTGSSTSRRSGTRTSGGFLSHP